MVVFFFSFALSFSIKNMIPAASGFLLWSCMLFVPETNLGCGPEKKACYQRPVFKVPSLEILTLLSKEEDNKSESPEPSPSLREWIHSKNLVE